MNAIALVFPDSKNLLCIWHFNKNLVANCKRFFGTGEEWDAFLADWNSLVSSDSIEGFNAAKAYLTSRYEDYPNAFHYVESQWMPYVDRFVACFVDCMHLGQTSTSRVEGNHHVLKSYILTSCLEYLAKLDFYWQTKQWISEMKSIVNL